MPDKERCVWKFPIALQDEQIVNMPANARVLSCAEQGGVLTLWALVDPEAPPKARRVFVRGTGDPVEGACAEACFIATVVTCGGRLVWHVFVEEEEGCATPES